MRQAALGVVVAALVCGCGGTGGRAGSVLAADARGGDGTSADGAVSVVQPTPDEVAEWYAKEAPSSNTPFVACPAGWPDGMHYAENAEREDCGDAYVADDGCWVWPDRCTPGYCIGPDRQVDKMACAHDSDCPPLHPCKAHW